MTHQSTGRSSCLSIQEGKVLKLITNGLGNKEIAASMRRSTLTVKRHVENILRKLHVKNRVESAMYAVRTGACELEGINRGNTKHGHTQKMGVSVSCRQFSG